MSFYRQQLEDWLATLDVQADSVLDIGGAQGEVKDRVKSWNVNKYQVLDLPEWNMNLIWHDKELENLQKPDIIFCLEVFEYLWNPVAAFNNFMMLEPKRIYATFAFVYPFHNETEYDSLRYTENGIRLLADNCGFKIANIWYRIDRSGLLQQFYSADGMHPAREYAHHNATGFIVELSK